MCSEEFLHGVGADGDAASLRMAEERLGELGLEDRVAWMHTSLEDMDVDQQFDLVTNNVSMHAQIDDHLVAPSVYLDLLERHAFEDVDSFTLTPVHAVTHGRRPR